MDQVVDLARAVAGEVLSRMDIGSEQRLPPVGEEPGGAEAASVYFTTGVPREEAVAATASQIQDHAIGAMWRI